MSACRPLPWLVFGGLLTALPAYDVDKKGSATWKHGHLRAETSQATRQSKPDEDDEGNEVIGFFVGIFLWCFVPVCLWNNERIAIKQYKMQFKAERWAIHIDDTEREPLKEMDGRIAYLSGVSTCDAALADSKFPLVKSEGKLKLRRHVQMFQWVEKERTENKRKVYYWKQEWSDKEERCPHDYSGSKQNPPMPMPSTRRQEPYRAYYDRLAGNGDACAEAPHEKVRLGAYYFGELVIRELLNWKVKNDINVDMLQTKNIVAIGSDGAGMSGEPVLKDSWWYFGGTYETLGRVRVRFEELCPGPTSIVGVIAKTSKGWTFAPIKRADAAGTGENCAAEIGGCCFVRVKELHYGDQDDDDDFQQDIEKRPAELTRREKAAFNKSQTVANVEEYQIEDDFSDLCCVGPFGSCVIRFMHWLGLEEEFLAVREKILSLEGVMEVERGEAANRHHLARIGGFFLLVLGSWLIISPVIAILNFNWITTLLGGGLISLALCIGACLCSTSCFCLIVSMAWIAHRPFLATLGIISAISIVVGIYFHAYNQEKKASDAESAKMFLLAAGHVVKRMLLHG